MQVLGGTIEIKKSLDVRAQLKNINLRGLSHALVPIKESGDKVGVHAQFANAATPSVRMAGGVQNGRAH